MSGLKNLTINHYANDMKKYYVSSKPKNPRFDDKKAKQIKTIHDGHVWITYGGFYNCHIENGVMIIWNCYAKANWHFAVPISEIINIELYFVGLPTLN